MHLPIVKIVVVAIASAFGAVLGIFRYAFINGKSPSEDGLRALIAEFLGDWIGCFFLIWSFTVAGKTLQWEIRGAAIVAVLIGLGLSAYFTNATEAPDTTDKEPTGFKNNSTSLHLE
jgi:hypothetical protein